MPHVFLHVYAMQACDVEPRNKLLLDGIGFLSFLFPIGRLRDPAGRQLERNILLLLNEEYMYIDRYRYINIKKIFHSMMDRLEHETRTFPRRRTLAGDANSIIITPTEIHARPVFEYFYRSISANRFFHSLFIFFSIGFNRAHCHEVCSCLIFLCSSGCT